jgi:aspartate aminotransferase
MKEILIDPHVDTIFMPENLRVGLMVAEQRKRCEKAECPFDYAGFAFGQSPFHLPPILKEALAKHAGEGHYSAAEGIVEIREAIAGFNKRYFGIDEDPSRIVVGPGTKGLIFTIFTMVNGHFIIPSPSWIGYFPLRPEYNYKIQTHELEVFLSKIAHEKEQHMLIINNPHNPTGVLYSEEELAQIADVCRRNNTLVLSDEIYAMSTYKFEDFKSMGLIYPEGTFVTNGLSKACSAGGYRFGYCILPECCSGKLKTDFKKIAATLYTNISSPTQYAAISAYEPNDQIKEYFQVTRNIHRMMGLFMSEEFNKIEGVRATTPQGTFYFLADFDLLAKELNRKGILTSNELGATLLDHPYHVATVTGDTLMARPDDYSARIAFVDYNGKETFDRYRHNPPKSKSDEIEFVKENAPRMISGIQKLRAFVEDLKK